MKGLKRLFGIATLVLLMVLTIAPINTFANESTQGANNKVGEEPKKGKVTVVYEAKSPIKQLKEVELTGEVGTAYSIEILDFDGYTFTEIAPPDGGHAQLEGFFEEQEQHAFLYYEANIFTTIKLGITVLDNKNIKGQRPDTYTYSIHRKDPSTGVETLFHTESLDITDVSEDYLYKSIEIEGEYPRFNSEGKKYEYRLETQEIPYYKNTDKMLDFNIWTNNMDVTIEEVNIADTVDITINKRFGSDIDTRRRSMNSPKQGVIPQRPESVTIHVKRDGSDIVGSPVVLNDANNWEASFNDLPNIDSSGKEIQYEVIEDHIQGFHSVVKVNSDDTSTFNNKRYLDIRVVNQYVVDITATKVWVNAPTVKPDVTLQLHIVEYEYDLELGAEVEREIPIGDPVVLNNGQTTATWSNLDKYTEMFGKFFENVYRVRELDVLDDYIVEYSEDTYTITNTYTPLVVPKVDITGTKTWVDDNDAAGLRPTSITVNLLKNGTKIDSVEVNADNGWKYSFTGLPKQENGQDIVYSVSEELVSEYNVSYQGHNITNTYAPKAPTDPEVPVEPTDPEVPVVPTDPEIPVEPIDPKEPVVPTDPEVPVIPVEPIEPGNPSEPESPQLPNTGISNIVLVTAMISMLSGLILLLSTNKRRVMK